MTAFTGVQVSAGFAAGVRARAAARLGPFTDRVRALPRQARVLYADQTPSGPSASWPGLRPVWPDRILGGAWRRARLVVGVLGVFVPGPEGGRGLAGARALEAW